MKEKQFEYVGILSPIKTLKPSVNFSNSVDITLTIGTLEKEHEWPRNWLRRHDDTNTPGGCSCRVWVSEFQTKPLTSWYGPNINYGGIEDYAHALAAMKRIATRLNRMNDARGCTDDAAEFLGRFAEAAGITKIFTRPEGREREWHNEGAWETIIIGAMIRRVRTCYPQVDAKPAEASA